MVDRDRIMKIWQRERDKVASHIKFMRFQYSRGGLRNLPNVRRELNDSMRKYIKKSISPAGESEKFIFGENNGQNHD